MNLTIISIGNKLSPWELDGINYYTKQLKNKININFINIKGQQHPKRSIEEVLKLESDYILKKIPDDSFLISWDSSGDRVDSKEFSKVIENSMTNNLKVCLLIGGSFGLNKNILKNSQRVLSASNFTFPHRLFRIILIEQIYRAFSIINNSPYHK
ncbi:23S rRNA (pseudouridine(1915)-N(3))-methyltransferase RlmH [Gammaproteobacteria bacterium]|nr:23S rRNA (pseudouridine(1915)-N(3))-methyltransferase RlmH [Gammaproteobacteria bacterium]